MCGQGRLTSALVSEVWEKDLLLREDKQSQSASSQRVVVHSPRVWQNLPALVYHHPAVETQQQSPMNHTCRHGTIPEKKSVLMEVHFHVVYVPLPVSGVEGHCGLHPLRCWQASGSWHGNLDRWLFDELWGANQFNSPFCLLLQSSYISVRYFFQQSFQCHAFSCTVQYIFLGQFNVLFTIYREFLLVDNIKGMTSNEVFWGQLQWSFVTFSKQEFVPVLQNQKHKNIFSASVIIHYP